MDTPIYDEATLDAVIDKLTERRSKTKWTSDAHVITLAIKDVEGLRAPKN